MANRCAELAGNACAACKHWEKRCIEGECEFAPYFPADRMEDFAAVQRVFEMSNVSRMLKGTDQIWGGPMAKSLIWEANCWKDEPVHGPLGHHLDHVRKLENQIGDKDQKIRQLTAMVTLLQQQAIRTYSNVGLRPHHHEHHLQIPRAPMLFQENAMFRGGYNVPWGGLTFTPATAYNQNPVIVQENATSQAGGYMPPHHPLVDHRAPIMLFQENDALQGVYNVASSSTFPPATAYNQNPVTVQENATFQVGGYMPSHHLLVYHRAPMLFQENDALQGVYNVASISTFPPATAYNSYRYILPGEGGGITVGGEDQHRSLLQRQRSEGDDGRQH